MSPPPASAELADGFSACTPASPVVAPAPKPLPAIRAARGANVAIALVVGATALFAVGDTFAKVMTETLPAAQVAWMRFVVFAAVMIPMALIMVGKSALRPAAPLLQILRGAGVAGSAGFFILALESLDLAQATAINFLSPVLITALSIPILGERVSPARWAAAAVGFAGVLLVVRPGGASFTLAAALPALAALSWAVAAVVTRKITVDRPETTLAWSAGVGLLLLSCAVPSVWTQPSGRELLLALATGLFSTAGHGLLVIAFRKASAAALAPFSYAQLLFAGVIGYVAFSSVPGPVTILGCTVIAASGVMAAWLAQKGRRVDDAFSGEPARTGG